MARMRTIKPEAFVSMSLADVDRGVRWTFAGLWTHCDDDGRTAWEPRLVKAALYPLDDEITKSVIEADLRALERVGAVCFYTVDGREYLHIPNFHAHQHPNRKVDSKLPPCPKADHTFSVDNSSDLQRTASTVSQQPQSSPVVVVVEESRGDVEVGGADSAKTARRASRIADNFQPTPDDIAWARTKNITDTAQRAETEKFVLYWRAKSGKDATKLDWSATWKGWLLRAFPNGSPSAGRGAASDKAMGWIDLPTPDQPAIEGRSA